MNDVLFKIGSQKAKRIVNIAGTLEVKEQYSDDKKEEPETEE